MILIKLIVVLLLIGVTLTTVTQISRKGNKISVQGNVNQTTNILIPFQHLISATVSDQKYQKNLAFSPNRFRLKPIKQSHRLPKENRTMFQQLRSPFSTEYIHIFSVGPYFFVFKMPNQFLVLQEHQSQFKLQREFRIPEITTKNLKFQMFNRNLLLLYLSHQKMVSIGPQATKVVLNPFNTTNVAFSSEFSPKQKSKDAIAYFNNNFYHVASEKQTVKVKNIISIPGAYKLNNVKIISVFTTDDVKIGWIVDKELGLFWMKISSQYEVKDEPLLILHQSGCYQFDIRQEKQIKILLTCSSNGESFFIKAIFIYQNHKPILVKQWSPHIQSCKTKRFIFFNQHIFSLEKQSVDVFLPSIYKGEKELFYVKNWINLQGHSAYWIDRVSQTNKLYLYSVNNYQFSKSQLILEQYSLQIRSNHQLNAKFNLTVEYVCSSESKVKEICLYETQIEVDLHNKNLSFIQHQSINLAIIFLLLTTISAVAFICCIKYKSIEERAIQQLKEITNPKDYKL